MPWTEYIQQNCLIHRMYLSSFLFTDTYGRYLSHSFYPPICTISCNFVILPIVLPAITDPQFLQYPQCQLSLPQSGLIPSP